MRALRNVVVGVVLLLILYVGAYRFTVEPYRYLPQPEEGLILSPEADQFVMVPRYLFGGELAEKVFWPMAQIDKRLRPEVWKP